MNQTTEPPRFKTVSGKWVVLGLLGFGILATGTLWIFSKLDLAPFVPLIKALDREFPESKPQVKGGRSKRQPPMLRVVMQVDFTPAETDPRVVKIFERVVALSKEHLDLAEYENFELHIVRYIPQKNAERILIQRKISEL
jgi:hypothetical protein